MKKDISMSKLAIISMSGGLDSATLCAEALNRGYDVFVLNFNYSQKNWVEKYAFTKLLEQFESRDDFEGKIIGHSVLNLNNLFSEFFNLWAEMRETGKIKKEAKHEFYTPSRNLLFAVVSAVIGEIIALARDYDEVLIGLGIHQHTEAAYGEHRNYWDITPEFAKRLENLLKLNNVKKIDLFAPFADKFKKDIILRVKELKVPYNSTWTCYNPQQVSRNIWMPCEECEACVERQLAGEAAGIEDINKYSIEIRGHAEGDPIGQKTVS